ncbi:hypothetical protein NW759_016761 [Fusarium solani]|nr:hypothetical protein NW759_016761 [Fusarium solani]
MTDVYAKIFDHGFYHYYSPGLHCPQGWTTAAALVNEGGSFTEISGYLTQSYSRWLGHWEPGRAQPSDPDEIWKQVLLPSETLKICCPRSNIFLWLHRTVWVLRSQRANAYWNSDNSQLNHHSVGNDQLGNPYPGPRNWRD